MTTTPFPLPAAMASAPMPRLGVLTPAQRRAVAGLLVLGHGLVGWGLLQDRLERGPSPEPQPLKVAIVPAAAPAPREPEPTARPLPSFQPPLLQLPMPEVQLAQAPVPAPPAMPVALAEPAAAAPAPAERLLPAAAVQYLEPPVLVYPRASRRAGEAGRVLLRVFIDEQGLPRQVQVNRSSGFARLDEAAIEALRKARFKPCVAEGQPVAGWALVPLTFELQA